MLRLLDLAIDKIIMYDNTCKYLAERFPEDLASWLLGTRIPLVQMQPTELNVEPIRADSMILLANQDLILHIEFQTAPEPNMGFRMLDYRVRAHRKFPNKRMRQIVIYLVPTTSEFVFQTTFELESIRYEYEVIRLWEQPSELFLQSVGLYPFAALAQTQEPESMLRTVAARIEEIPARDERANVAATTSILAGLVLDREQIQRILRSEIMRESVMYQVLKDEARAEAFAEAKAEAEAQVRAEAKAEAEAQVRAEAESKERQLVIRLLTRKLGNIQPQLQDRVNNLTIDRVESLGEALLDFTSAADLEAWLSQN